MSLKQQSEKRHSLASRLTLLYAAIFSLSTVAVFFSLHLSLSYIIKTKTDEELIHEFSELVNSYNKEGIEELKQTMLLESQADGLDRLYLRLLTKDGNEISATSNASFGVVPVNQAIVGMLNAENTKYFESNILPQEQHRVRIMYGLLDSDIVLQVVYSQKEENRFLNVFWRVVVVALIFLATLASLIGWFMSNKALSGVEEITQAANEIAAGELARRVAVKKSGDEIEQLATTFNAMLDRIESLISSMRELTDNIAHDLRSPIARIRALAESTLFELEQGDPSESLAATTIEECDHLLGMINTMLEISEAEVGVEALTMQEIDLVGLVMDGCELFEPVAEGKDIAMNINLPASLFVKADRQKLQRIVANLLDNALKYTGQGGEVTIHASRDGNNVYLAISDNGIGIAESQIPHIFKRFYRCDTSRTESGVGLGLSLAKALCKAHGGEITVTSTPNVGSTFTVVLPS